MQTTLGVDVLGVVSPARCRPWRRPATAASGCSPRRRRSHSGAYARAIAAADPLVDVTERRRARTWRAIIEGGFPFDERVVDTVRAYCAPLREAGVDTVILGCTHYPLVRPMLQRMLGRGVDDRHLRRAARPPGRARARRARARHARDGGEGAYRFLCTGDAERFRALGTRFLQLPLGEVEHVGSSGRVDLAVAPP